MGELHELVDIAAINRIFTILAVAGPIAGIVFGAIVCSRRGQARRGAFCGLVLGALFTLNWALWRLYNTITGRYGLDTVRNLFINLAVFISIGIIIGLAAARFARPGGDKSNASEE